MHDYGLYGTIQDNAGFCGTKAYMTIDFSTRKYRIIHEHTGQDRTFQNYKGH